MYINISYVYSNITTTKHSRRFENSNKIHKISLLQN